MMYAYFPGCSAHSTGISYTNSYNYVALAAGVELAEIPNWNCCGASAAHAESELLGDALPHVRSLFRKKHSAMLLCWHPVLAAICT